MGLYLVIVNVLTFFLFAIDKAKARADAWRISERILLLFTIAGGSPGALMAMVVFRHKIRKQKFRIGVPIILMVQIILLCYAAGAV